MLLELWVGVIEDGLYLPDCILTQTYF
jgi:hypothetical protein